MKHLTPVFFTLLYLVAMVRPVVPIIEFVVDQDYIAEFLCINTDKPELECNGKCYLMQMLQEQENEKQDNLPRIDLSEYPIGFIHVSEIPLKNTFEVRSAVSFYDRDNYSYTYIFSTFHPPTFI
ncbi:hypothetical protein N9Y48_01710 [Zobellia sp.]|nr:hypothetical protein [Zobellia sp.]